MIFSGDLSLKFEGEPYFHSFFFVPEFSDPGLLKGLAGKKFDFPCIEIFLAICSLCIVWMCWLLRGG